MLSSAILPLKLRIVWSDPFPIFLVLAFSTSIMNVLRWVRVIRIITRGRVWRVIFSMLATLFLIFTFLPFLFWVWRWRIWRIRWWRIWVWCYFWSVIFAIWCWNWFWSNRLYSSHNIRNRFRSNRFYSSRNIENRFRSSHFYSSRNVFARAQMF